LEQYSHSIIPINGVIEGDENKSTNDEINEVILTIYMNRRNDVYTTESSQLTAQTDLQCTALHKFVSDYDKALGSTSKTTS